MKFKLRKSTNKELELVDKLRGLLGIEVMMYLMMFGINGMVLR